MQDLSEPSAISAEVLRQMLAAAKNDADTALSRSCKALIDWAQAQGSPDAWPGSADYCRELFVKARQKRVEADGVVEELRARLKALTGRSE